MFCQRAIIAGARIWLLLRTALENRLRTAKCVRDPSRRLKLSIRPQMIWPTHKIFVLNDGIVG